MNNTKVEKIKETKFIETRDMNELNISNLIAKVKNYDWSFINSFENVDSAYGCFLNIFKKMYDDCCPVKTKQRNVKFRKQWMTPALLRSCKTKDNLFKKYQTSPTTENRVKYNAYKNLFTSLKRKAEKNYLSNKLEQAKNNLKETWRIIKDVINKKTTDFSFPDSFKYENTIIKDPGEIGNKFNEFFVTIGPKLDAKIDPPQVEFQTYLRRDISDSFYIKPTTPEEIMNIIHVCKNKQSSGWDDIPMTIIKYVGPHIAAPFAHICNLSFSSGLFPSEMKTAKVTPVYKGDSRDEFSNYRPISLLPNFSKILEKIMFNRLSEFLNKHEILYEQQYGFRQNFSTDLALLELSDKIAESIDAKKYTIGIFVDLSKAFDTLNHGILLQKLFRYGIRGIANNWFQNYLHERQQYVMFNNVTSTKCKITTGVPQGSILGPLLFLLYINDICRSSEILKFILYADDTNIFYSCESLDQLCEVVNRELHGVMQWFRANRLSVNLKKTNFVIFGSSGRTKKIDKCEIFLDNIKILRTEKAKFLGVIIDENLSWKNHITYIKGKISKNIGIINRLKYRVSEGILLSLYDTLVLPYLNYCNIVWANNKTTRLQPLVLLQKRAMRLITTSAHNAHTIPLFSKLNRLTLVDMNKLLIATFMFRSHTKSLPNIFSGYFCSNASIHGHFTRNSSKLHISHARTDVRRFQIRIYGPKLWNSIDPAIINKSFNWRAFKHRYKKYLLSQYK
jgi:hypothetical protein